MSTQHAKLGQNGCKVRAEGMTSALALRLVDVSGCDRSMMICGGVRVMGVGAAGLHEPLEFQEGGGGRSLACE